MLAISKSTPDVSSCSLSLVTTFHNYRSLHQPRKLVDSLWAQDGDSILVSPQQLPVWGHPCCSWHDDIQWVCAIVDYILGTLYKSNRGGLLPCIRLSTSSLLISFALDWGKPLLNLPVCAIFSLWIYSLLTSTYRRSALCRYYQEWFPLARRLQSTILDLLWAGNGG